MTSHQMRRTMNNWNWNRNEVIPVSKSNTKVRIKPRYFIFIILAIVLFGVIGYCLYDIFIVNGDRLLFPTGITRMILIIGSVLLLLLLVIFVLMLQKKDKIQPADENLDLVFKDINQCEKERYEVKHLDDRIVYHEKLALKYKKRDNEAVDFQNNLSRAAFDKVISHLPSRIQSQATTLNLDENIDEKASETGKSRFANLTRLDNYFETEFKEPEYNDSISLSEYCEAFRNFSAYTLHLYYDIKDIRRFIAGLAVTKLLILQGMSGTGKTSLALAFGKFLDNTTTVIPIQPMWKERTDLIGYYNEFTKEFNETDLLNKMYEANYNNQIYITVLDEMNIARVEYYFAEFLSLLELPNPEERNLVIVSSRWQNDPKKIDKEGKLRMPLNMWFIGTANNDDSTFAISDKVYDRAMVINLDSKAEVFEGKDIGSIRLSSDYYYKKVNEAILEYSLSERNKRRIKKLDEYLVEKFHITFGNRIMKQINVYVPVLVACGGTELDGLDDILSRKVLRKLESKNPVYVKSQAEALCNKIDEIFGTDKMPLCKQAIYNIEKNS